ncbi:EutN/CcmL family microcompartment protein [Kaustia mangrovi]|uniref:EutN/CcmL family microcompartment protein n=1 Tax=Kaustia mangrovi TaxID=2593653 RepID=A0A7S8C341_9HYPH|nr:EutN/CcmL family microcompartment protein [Kaustia mangrovi]QPC42503.1 EutN/CcmL family microcompartment protein [Kaustia mangrovi]
MKTGIVIGKVWATKRLDELPGGALLEIALEEGRGGGDTGERLIALDPLGAGDGERVLVTQGSVARSWFKDPKAVVDALVIGILDEPRKASG